jgi:hypothetical protein
MILPLQHNRHIYTHMNIAKDYTKYIYNMKVRKINLHIFMLIQPIDCFSRLFGKVSEKFFFCETFDGTKQSESKRVFGYFGIKITNKIFKRIIFLLGETLSPMGIVQIVFFFFWKWTLWVNWSVWSVLSVCGQASIYKILD